MKLVRQPKESNLCGQACVATLEGISLDDAIMVMGTKGCTRTKQLKQALWQLGTKTGDKLKRGLPECETAVMRWIHPNGNSHWIVWHKGKHYDPAYGIFAKKRPKYLEVSRTTSHLEVIYL